MAGGVGGVVVNVPTVTLPPPHTPTGLFTRSGSSPVTIHRIIKDATQKVNVHSYHSPLFENSTYGRVVYLRRPVSSISNEETNEFVSVWGNWSQSGRGPGRQGKPLNKGNWFYNNYN